MSVRQAAGRALSLRHKLWIKAQIYRCKILIMRGFASHRWLASAYYFLFDRSFDREHLAVLRGQLAFKASSLQPAESSPLLRRNIHRLEKGLLMRPRRAVFAEDYIAETVDIFVRSTAQTSFCVTELSWANDVLQRYFATVEHTTIITEAYNRFIATTTLKSSEKVPFPYQQLATTSVTYADFLALCQRRHSVRWFDAKEPARADVARAVVAAAEAPSACNRQPFSFRLFYGQQAHAVAELAMGTVGFATNIPSLLVIVGDLSAYKETRDRHLIYIDASLAAMQLMLALETLGLASCPINWPDIEARESRMQKVLQLDEYQRPVMLIAIGYADPTGLVAYSDKKPVEQLLHD